MLSIFWSELISERKKLKTNLKKLKHITNLTLNKLKKHKNKQEKTLFFFFESDSTAGKQSAQWLRRPTASCLESDTVQLAGPGK